MHFVPVVLPQSYSLLERMSVLRSPTGNNLSIAKDDSNTPVSTPQSDMSEFRFTTGIGLNTGRCGSYPELSTKFSSEIAQTPSRNKRKFTDENQQITTELAGLREQMENMMSFIKSANTTQTENINKISENITTIKEQINNITLTTHNLKQNQNKMQLEIDNLRKANNIAEKRIETLESNIKLVQAAHSDEYSSATPLICENIITELQERNFRAKNIIVAGIPEPKSINKTEMENSDEIEIAKIVKMVVPDSAKPLRIFRLGKLNTDKNRPIKVCFESQDSAINILKNKNNINHNSTVKIYSDQTPCQREQLKKLKDELGRRSENGEKNLSIKYIKGIPKIIALSKNSKN